jgi:hypothetical protein
VVFAVVTRLRFLDWVVEDWALEVLDSSAEHSIDAATVASRSLDTLEAKYDIEDAIASNNLMYK